MTPSQYRYQNCTIVIWSLRNKHQPNGIRNLNISIQENAFEDVVCKMLVIFLSFILLIDDERLIYLHHLYKIYVEIDHLVFASLCLSEVHLSMYPVFLNTFDIMKLWISSKQKLQRIFAVSLRSNTHHRFCNHSSAYARSLLYVITGFLSLWCQRITLLGNSWKTSQRISQKSQWMQTMFCFFLFLCIIYGCLKLIIDFFYKAKISILRKPI